jgi:5-methylthioadenosine/S-adenosylhomocysteine deaminase
MTRDVPQPPFDQQPIDLVVRNAKVVTADAQWAEYDPGGIVVSGSAILAVGPDAALADHARRAKRVIDAEGAILAPGFVNTHCHAANSLFRGIAEGLPLEPWLDRIWRAEHAVLSPEVTFLGTSFGLAENLLCGTTTVMDMYWYPEAVVKAAASVGVRIATGPHFFELKGMDKAAPDRRLDMAHSFFAAHRDDAHLIPTVMAHGAYTVGPKMLRQAHELAASEGALFCTHAAETREEQRTIQERYGATVIRHLDSLGVLGPGTVLAHCVHLDEGERDLLAERQVAISHNPASNLKIGAGVAPIPELLARGARVSLGTDGPISGNDLDMWKALRYAAIIHNGRLEDPTAILPRQAYAMATRNGADALGLLDEIGGLEPGKRADFILVRTDSAHASPIFDPLDHLVYGASKSDVTDVFSAGEQVVKDGQLTRVHLPELVAGVRALKPAILRALGE